MRDSNTTLLTLSETFNKVSKLPLTPLYPSATGISTYYLCIIIHRFETIILSNNTRNKFHSTSAIRKICMKLKGIRNDCIERNGWLVSKLVDDHQIRLMDIIDESSLSHHLFKKSQSQANHGQHYHHSPLSFHPLTTSIITLIIVFTLFWMMTISSACSEDGTESLEIQKRSTRGRCVDEGYKDMCERCSKVTRSTVIFVGCCKEEPDTKNYCMDLLGLDRGRARRDLRLPAVWIRILRR